MPELSFRDLPKILEENKSVKLEVENLERKYLQDFHPKGWSKIEGARKYISQNHFLIEAPVEDQSFGGFIRTTNKNNNICFINTYQPRNYQNFSLLHELYHIISLYKFSGNFHLIHAGIDERENERKADYFASLLLMDEYDLTSFFKGPENSNEDDFKKVMLCMNEFKAPYKAVLLRLYELKLIEDDFLEEHFDKKVDYKREFQKLGLDLSTLQRSKKVNFTQLEQLMNEFPLPSVAQDSNEEVFNEILSFFKGNEEESS